MKEKPLISKVNYFKKSPNSPTTFRDSSSRFLKEFKPKPKMKGFELNLIKYILFIFNLVFAISGIGLIIAGSVVLSDVGEFSHFMEGKILAPPVVLIVAGVIVFLVASLGCYGAIKESYYMLMAFAICLLIIFIIEFAVGIAAASYKSDFRLALKNTMKNSLESYEYSKSDKIAWDNLQKKLECCGVDGPNDWKNRPISCCHFPRTKGDELNPKHCINAQPIDDYLYKYGCFTELEMKAEKASKILIGVGIGVAFIEIIGIILACWLASAVKNKE